MTEWPTLSLEEICAEGGGFVRTGPFGSQLHQSDYIDDPNGIPVVMPKNMAGGAIDLDKIARIDQATADRLSHHLLAAGDVALSRRGDVGRSAFIEEDDLPVLCGTGSMRIHLGEPESVRPQFLRYFFRSRLASDYLEGHAVGATMPNLNASIVNAMPVPVPPIPVQEAIGHVLATLDDLIENNRRRVEVLEEMARAVYREWFVHFRFPGHEDATFVDSDLGPIPDGWKVRPLFESADVGFGYSYKSNRFDSEGPFPVIRIRNVPNGTTDTFTDEVADEKYRVFDGDILVGMDGEFYVAQWSGGDAWLNQRVARLRPVDGLGPRYLMQAAEGPIRDWNTKIVGTTVAHLGKKHLQQVQILVPDADTRSLVDEVLEPNALLIRDLLQQNRRLAGLRDMLLPKLVTGQIDVSDLDLDVVVEKVSA